MKMKFLTSSISILIMLLNIQASFSQCASDETQNMYVSKSTKIALVEPSIHNHNEEVNPQIPELSEFHEVIYQIWHNGWPSKDYELLKSLYPEAEEGYMKLKNVKMTGILQDKQKKWEEGINQLGQYLKDYNNAIEKNDNQALLDATEKLHFQYEQLVRLINPVIKELEEFHKVLYVLYHYDYPEYNYDEIQRDVAELSKKMDELKKAGLPKRLESKQKEFDASRAELDKAVKNLEKTLKEVGNNKKEISKAIEEMHSKYQQLEGVFD